MSVYMTDFGAVRLGPKAQRLPKRKDGNFDHRYTSVRQFVKAINAEAQRVYLNSRTANLHYYDIPPLDGNPATGV